MKRNKYTEKGIGIYQIKSIINNKKYIGSSIHIKRRKKEHFHALIQNKHPNYNLQNHYNKYGKNDFIFTVLKRCSEKELIKEEQYYINILKPDFNIRLIIGKQVKETKEKISATLKGHKVSKKTRQKISISLLGKPGTFLGKKHTDETKKKIGLAGTGRIPPNKGKSPSEKTKQKIKNANIKYWNSKEGKEIAKKRAEIYWGSEKGIIKKEKLRTTFMTDEIKLKISQTLKKRHLEY